MSRLVETKLSSGLQQETVAGDLTPASPSDETRASPCLDDDAILALLEGRNARPSALDDHLDACEVCRDLVLAVASNADSSLLGDRPFGGVSRSDDFFLAGRYRLERVIGRGGMGTVYEAFDGLLNQRIALKAGLPMRNNSARSTHRQMAEVQLARRVSHPNVCRTFDFGAHEGETFITMEYVEGQTLSEHLRSSGPLPSALTQALIRQLLAGLAAAHAAGILHGDLKSSNIMLQPQHVGPPRAVIMDFGLARALDAALTPNTSQNVRLVGTLGYMAPEQFEGRALSRATDIYALGTVWFEMLTGRLPFGGSSPGAMFLARLRTEAPAPSRFAPRVPREIDAIVSKCLAREPRARFQHAADVLAALDAATDEASLSRRVLTRVAGVRPRTSLVFALSCLGVATTFWLKLQPSPTGQRNDVSARPAVTALSADEPRVSSAPGPAMGVSRSVEANPGEASAPSVAGARKPDWIDPFAKGSDTPPR